MNNNLTRREKEIFDLILEGYSTDEIAKELVLKPSTVRTHYKSIYSKCEVNSKTDLILKSIKK